MNTEQLVEEIMDLARAHPIDEARIYITDRIAKDALKPLVGALLRAKATIRQWNGMGLSGEAERACWEAYQHSPEMQEINAALASIQSTATVALDGALHSDATP